MTSPPPLLPLLLLSSNVSTSWVKRFNFDKVRAKSTPQIKFKFRHHSLEVKWGTGRVHLTLQSGIFFEPADRDRARGFMDRTRKRHERRRTVTRAHQRFPRLYHRLPPPPSPLSGWIHVCYLLFRQLSWQSPLTDNVRRFREAYFHSSSE